MIYPLIEIRHLLTVHAACVMFQGKGILLAGDSGAGKSSLAYACARRNWTYVSDDASAFVRAAARPKIIGHPQKFRFREPVGELFPEFRGLTSSIRAYGKPTIEIRTQTLEGFRTADQSPVDRIVFLNRRDYQGGLPTVQPVSREEIWKRFSFSVWAVQMPEFHERLAAVEGLLEIPAYEMRYGDLDSAVDLLESLARDH
jgi:GTPase SAR1 family protein